MPNDKFCYNCGKWYDPKTSSNVCPHYAKPQRPSRKKKETLNQWKKKSQFRKKESPLIPKKESRLKGLNRKKKLQFQKKESPPILKKKSRPKRLNRKKKLQFQKKESPLIPKKESRSKRRLNQKKKPVRFAKSQFYKKKPPPPKPEKKSGIVPAKTQVKPKVSTVKPQFQKKESPPILKKKSGILPTKTQVKPKVSIAKSQPDQYPDLIIGARVSGVRLENVPNENTILEDVRSALKGKEFKGKKITLSENASVEKHGDKWFIVDKDKLYIVKKGGTAVYEEGTVANCSSRVPKGQLDHFVSKGLIDNKKLKGMGGLGFPVFSVCDCNSFHTSGYLWGLYAAKMAKDKKMTSGSVAVINFDQHPDAGTFSQAIPKSDSWGCMLVNTLKEIGYDACYLTLFNTGSGGTSSFHVRGIKSKTAPKIPGNVTPKAKDLEKKFKTFWGDVNKYFGEGNEIKYVFVSIDRDCLKGSLTQWGDGCFGKFGELRQAMDNVLKPLFDSKAFLIGFDVTGLPEDKARHGVTIAMEKVWENLDDDLKGLLEDYIKPKFERTVEALDSKKKTLDLKRHGNSNVNKLIFWGKALFFSGSVSYGVPPYGKKYRRDSWNFESFVGWTGEHLENFLKAPFPKAAPQWKYVLCQQKPSVYKQAWKQFNLYESSELESPVPLGGFACTASVSASDSSTKIIDMINKKGDFEAPPEQEEKEKK